jgi:hypothetical protein
MPRRINPQTFGREFVESLREAFDTVGGHHYLTEKAMTHPKEFMQLLAKVIPQDVSATVRHEIVDIAEAMKAANERIRLERGEPMTIEPMTIEPMTIELTPSDELASEHTGPVDKPQTGKSRARRRSRPLAPKRTP